MSSVNETSIIIFDQNLVSNFLNNFGFIWCHAPSNSKSCKIPEQTFLEKNFEAPLVCFLSIYLGKKASTFKRYYMFIYSIVVFSIMSCSVFFSYTPPKSLSFIICIIFLTTFLTTACTYAVIIVFIFLLLPPLLRRGGYHCFYKCVHFQPDVQEVVHHQILQRLTRKYYHDH